VVGNRLEGSDKGFGGQGQYVSSIVSSSCGFRVVANRAAWGIAAVLYPTCKAPRLLLTSTLDKSGETRASREALFKGLQLFGQDGGSVS
jgi:hypothetical protein